MKRLIKISSAIIMTVIIALGTIIAMPKQVSAYNSEVSSGVVAITEFGYNVAVIDKYGNVYDEWGDMDLWRGSGFFVGENDAQYIVTNCHVVSNFIDSNEGEAGYSYYTTSQGVDLYLAWDKMEIRVYYSENDYDNAYVIDYGSMDKVDLAVLKLSSPTDERKPLSLYAIPESERDSYLGEDIYTVGYPGNADNDFTSASKFGLGDATIAKGTIQKFVMNDKGVNRIQIDATIQHGNSGGPLVTEEGYVIGVNTNVESNSPYSSQIEADYYSIDASHVIEMLDKNNIKYTVGGEQSSVSEEDSSDSSSDSDSSAPASDSGSKDSSSEGGSTGIIIIIFAVVVAAVIVIVILAKKKAQGTNAKSKDDEFKTEAAPVRPVVTPAPAQVAAPQRIAMARSLAPQHNGASFSLAHGAITVGRDASVCKIVYQAGTAGVSGKHCTIEYRPAQNVFIVTDLNSSYGTMLANGTKMEPNRHYSFNPGDSIFVGDKANEIRFEVH